VRSFVIERFLERDVRLWYAAALLLVLLRCLPSMYFEQLDFDSDQAVVGLMAKHLVERRHFPLFFYGQHYMLGAQAWIAAPFFAIGGPTIAMLRLPLVLINIVVVFWLMRHLIERGVRAGAAFFATLPLIAPGTVASLLLMATLGASVEPFLVLLLLWSVRRRPALFGALFAIGYLHREFVAFALPALILVYIVERPTLGRSVTVYAGKAVAAFAAVWLAVAALTTRINTLGPAGGEFSPGSLVAQSQLLTMRLAWDGSAYIARLRALLHDTLPNLFAAQPVPSWLVGVKSTLEVGSAAGGAGLMLAMLLATVCILRTPNQPHRDSNGFYLYLATIALATIAAYPLNGGIDPATPGVARYALFSLLLPIAILGACAIRRPHRVVRLAIAATLAVWAGANVYDNLRLIREYVVVPPPNNHRLLADYLVAKRIRYGRADYWDAYVVDFLARERVILAPTHVSRISAYDARVERNAGNAVTVHQQPCDIGARVAVWCIDDPLHR
jgi:hypothetical protein